MTTSWRAQQARGCHQEPCTIVQKRHHSNSALIVIPSGDNNDDDDDDNNSNNNRQLPLLHRSSSKITNHPKNSHANNSIRKRKKVLLYYYYIIPLLGLFAVRLIIFIIMPRSVVIVHDANSSSDDDASKSNNFTNSHSPFIVRYEHALRSNNLGSDLFIPLLYEHDKLLCRRKHKSQLSRYRTRYFAQMVRTGLALASEQQHQQQTIIPNGNNNDNTKVSFQTTTLNNLVDYNDGLPILVMDGDENGCNIQRHNNNNNNNIDTYYFPRLTWSDLSPKHTSTTTSTTRTTNTTTNNNNNNQTHHRHSISSSYCNTISMPSYETYKYYHRSHPTYHDWEHTFTVYAASYPWETKIPKAVWRGSTTYEGSQYTGAELQDTPRGRLVVIGNENTDVMDVGFHKIIQQYAAKEKEKKAELEKRFTMKRRMHPMDMMKYKAIIDIDGNNWSSRFGMLLCSNSIVIKIEPDFIEYFYGDNGTVRPNIHYLPASLENITQVVSYAVDAKNDNEMKAMIREANDWCKHSLSEEGLAHDALLRLEAYAKALDLYRNGSWRTEWNVVKKRFKDTIDDFVDCDAWSIVDWFTFPMFAGL